MKRIIPFVVLATSAALIFAQPANGKPLPPGAVPDAPNGFGTVPDESAPEITATRVVSGTRESIGSTQLSANEADKSVLVAKKGATVTATKTSIEKSGGDTTNGGQSNFYGLNAAVVAQDASALTLQGVSVTTNADGANAVFATGEKSTVTAKNLTVRTKANASRGLDATYGGTIVAQNVDIATEGAHSAAFATDRGEGTVTVTGGKATTAGEGSPVIYSTGAIAVKNLTGTATGAEIAVIEGKNSITIEKSTLTGGTKNGRETGSAVMLYQSMSGDANVGTSVFSATGATLTSTSDGPFFYVTNTTAEVNLTGTKLVNPTNTLLLASGNASKRGWGRRGTNGGTVVLNATKQVLSGDVVVDAISSVTLNLGAGTKFTGAINAKNAGKVNLALAKSARLTLTADSYVNELQLEDTSYKNIVSGGHTLYYNKDASANSALKGRTVILKDGGKIAGIEMTVSAEKKADRANGTKLPLQNRDGKDRADSDDKGKNGADAANGRPNGERPHVELTTVSGKLTYTGETDNAATLVGTDGKGTILKVLGMPKNRGDKDARRGENGGAPNGNARPPFPNGANGSRMGGTPPKRTGDRPTPSDAATGKNRERQKPVTLDDLKKLNGKDVEVKGMLDKDGKLLVFEATAK